jgi:ankyrin repeat protein
MLLEKGADVNAQGGYYGNALQAASAEGKKEVVGMLLEKGADVNARGGLYGNALQAAFSEREEEIIGMLLEKGADVNALGGAYSNALQAAESRDESDLNRNSAVYHPPSTYHQTSKFVIIISALAVFFILLRIGVWKGIEHVSG